MKKPIQTSKNIKQVVDLFPDLSEYPASEDIYNQLGKEADIDPEDTSKNKEIIKIDKNPSWNEKNFNQDKSVSDLDIPGAEIDDNQENIGSEDEENNLYSIGGDNHNDLEEQHD